MQEVFVWRRPVLDVAWLAEHKEGMPTSSPSKVDELIRYSCRNQPKRALALLKKEPALGRANLYAACAVGEAATVRKVIAREPQLANARGGPLEWPPILYTCFSDLLRTDKKRSASFVKVAKTLLAAGADPNVSYLYDGKCPLSALYGASGYAHHPGITKLLLEAGANPNDNESLYHSGETKNLACTRLLLKHGAKIEGTNAVHRKLDYDDLPGLKLLMDHGADPNLRSHAGEPLLHAALSKGRTVRFLALLAERGADLRIKDAHGITPFQLAARAGNVAAMKFFQKRGLAEALDGKSAFISACAGGDSKAALAAVKANPGLVKSLGAFDLMALPEAAWRGNSSAVKLMLKCGFPVATRGHHGETALHGAAWKGHLPSVKALLAAAAPVEVMEGMYNATPLGWALHGSFNCPKAEHDKLDCAPNYVGVVKALLAAGAKVPAWLDDNLPKAVRKLVTKK